MEVDTSMVVCVDKIRGPLVLDVMRNRIALGIIPGETYREPHELDDRLVGVYTKASR